MLASACSGAVLLGEAGLLANREATIHWGYVATLTNNYPGVKVKPDQSLVLSGEAQRIVMAGGGSSWQDLALYLIARFVGLKEAMEVAKVYMLQWHDMGQQPFAALMRFRQTNDAVINRCQKWAELNYRTPSPVAAMTDAVRPARALLRAPLRQGHGHEGDRLHPRAAARRSQADAGDGRSAGRSGGQ